MSNVVDLAKHREKKKFEGTGHIVEAWEDSLLKIEAEIVALIPHEAENKEKMSKLHMRRDALKKCIDNLKAKGAK